MRAHLRAGFTGEHVRVVVMHVLHEAAVDSEHAEGLQLVVAQHRAVVTQDQLGVAVAALHEGRDLSRNDQPHTILLLVGSYV